MVPVTSVRRPTFARAVHLERHGYAVRGQPQSRDGMREGFRIHPGLWHQATDQNPHRFGCKVHRAARWKGSPPLPPGGPGFAPGVSGLPTFHAANTARSACRVALLPGLSWFSPFFLGRQRSRAGFLFLGSPVRLRLFLLLAASLTAVQIPADGFRVAFPGSRLLSRPGKRSSSRATDDLF